jgi:hypothetical protein
MDWVCGWDLMISVTRGNKNQIWYRLVQPCSIQDGVQNETCYRSFLVGGCLLTDVVHEKKLLT